MSGKSRLSMKVGAAQRRALNLKWSTHNRKMAALAAVTGKSVVSWDLLAGYTCPAADICNTRVVNGKLQRHGQFACFAAVNESVHKQSFEAHQFNTKATRTPEFEAQFNADLDTLKPDIVRLFSSGDCYSLETLDLLVKNIHQRFPGVPMTYAFSPPFRPSSPEEDESIIKDINDSGARILFVGLGCPKQEKWMADKAGRVQEVMVGVGVAFDFIAGTKPKAPRWMQSIGLEWLFRLIQEPGRLWRRYLWITIRDL